MKISGHTVLITGGASGIGLALTERFIQHGNQVIIVGRNENKLHQIQSLYPHNVTAYSYDIGDFDQLNELVERIMDNHPDLNILINNAGIQYNYSFLGSSSLTSHQVMNEITVNLSSPVLLISKLLPLLTQQPEAAIVNVSSGLGIVPKKSAPVYCATKAGIHLFSKSLRYQLDPSNIKVFEIIPPVVDTEMTKGRGRNKITPEELANEFMYYFVKDKYEVPIGKVKLLTLINRWFPALAESILRDS